MDLISPLSYVFFRFLILIFFIFGIVEESGVDLEKVCLSD